MARSAAYAVFQNGPSANSSTVPSANDLHPSCRSLLWTNIVVDESSELVHEHTVLDVLDQRRSVRVRVNRPREQELQQGLLRRVVAEQCGDAPQSDLLHALQGVASHHGISAERDFRGVNPHFQGNQQHTGGPSRFTSLGRAVARSLRPRLRPSHRHTCVLWYDSLHRSSTLKQDRQALTRTDVGYPARY